MSPVKAKPTMKNGYFDHLTKEYDVLRMVERFVEENSEPVITKEDEKWAKSETLLLQALCLMLFASGKEKEKSAYWLQYTLSKAIPEPETSYLDALFVPDEDREENLSSAYSKYLAFKSTSYPAAKAIMVQAYEHLIKYTDDIKSGKLIDAYSVRKLSDKMYVHCQK